MADITPGAGSSVLITTNNLVDINGTLFFNADDGTSGQELWKSDGTAAGTARAADIHPGPGSSSPLSLVNFNGTLYFVATDGTSGVELYKSDGTAAGTVKVADINPDITDGPEAFQVDAEFVEFDGSLFFYADDGVHGPELWRTDALAAEVADFDASRATDVSVFRPSTGAWYVAGGTSAFWGSATDIPVPGDYNADATTDVAVYRPADGAWFIVGGASAVWGAAGDVPLPLPFAIAQS